MVVPPTLPMTEKIIMRREVRGARLAFVERMSSEARAKHESALAHHLRQLLGDAGLVGSYAARGSEIDPRFVATALTAYPRVNNERLTFHVASRASLMPGYAGIEEPFAGLPAVTPDIVLVPLVAVDLPGTRLGQGQGHYDRTLAALRAAGPVTAIGLAWEVQIVSAIPADPWDQPLDWIATPERLVDCRANR